jgi:putative oxygen-independent coproporphyrinogen III oxidase
MSTEKIISLYSGKAGAPHFTVLPPLALYIHLPWCIKKCPYCDFNSHEYASANTKHEYRAGEQPVNFNIARENSSAETTSVIPEAEYINALLADLDSALPLIWGRPISSIFLGGGTPSLFTPHAIDALLSGVRARIKLLPDAEITLEANPGTFEAGRFKGYAQAGVTRLSIGVQSFNDAHLQALCRVHNSAQARAAIEEAAQHFNTFNLDVMYALPEQTLAESEADIRAALSFSPPHISIYHLTLEPNTYFAKFPPKLPDDDAASQMQDRITELTQAQGYEHYEVSAYAKPNHHSRHNVNYWSFGDYLGIGAGAHSKLSFPNKILRQVRYRLPSEYMRRAIDGVPVSQENEVKTADVPFEFMLNALRLNEGFAPTLFAERAGLPLRTIEKELQAAVAKGLLERSAERIKPTALGANFLNDLQALFLGMR